jgi:sugar lactone lactonase YvrE
MLLSALLRAAVPAASMLLVYFMASAESTALHAETVLKPHLVTTFPPDSRGYAFFAESITADKKGNLYVSLSNWVDTCQVVRMSPDGTEKAVIASFPADFCATGFLLGVAFDDTQRLYVATYNRGPDVSFQGIYSIDNNGGLTLELSLPAASFPNGLAFHDGYLYVSDSAQGAIWRKGPGDPVVATSPWYTDAKILAPSQFGANGVAFYRDSLYIAVYFADAASTSGSIVRLPIKHDGSPFPHVVQVVPPDPRLATIDGIAFDILGRLWFTVNNSTPGVGGKFGFVNLDGSVHILADDPSWLDYTTMVVFGQTFPTMGTIFILNGGLNSGQTNLWSLFVGVPGVRLPAN